MKQFTFFVLICALLFSHSIYAQKKKKADFFDVDKIQEINITFEQDNWQYILDSLRVNGNGLLLATVDINGEVYENAGVRFRGSRSFTIGGQRNALFIKLNYITKGQKHQKYKRLKLSNSLRDPSMVREVLAYEIARNYMPAPMANYAKVNVNGGYYGLFVNVEPVADRFLKNHFGSDKGTFFKSEPNPDVKACNASALGALEYSTDTRCYLGNFEIESDEGWDDLIELTRILKEEPNRIEEVLDVDRTLWMLAFNNVIVNLSSYSGQQSQNYYLYKDTTTHRFSFIMWDLNLSFGSYKNTGMGSDLSLKELQQMDPLLHFDNPAKPLLYQLLQNDYYKKSYIAHLRTIVKDHFSNKKYAMRAQELQQMIKPALAEDQHWGYEMNDFNKSLTTTIGKRSKIPGIVELMDRRAKFLRSHPALSIIAPEVTEVYVLDREQFSEIKVEEYKLQAKAKNYPRYVTLHYRFSKKEPFQKINMYDDGQHHDGESKDGLYGITIEPPKGKKKIQYFFVAENQKAVSFNPPNYMFKPYKTKLSDLND